MFHPTLIFQVYYSTALQDLKMTKIERGRAIEYTERERETERGRAIEYTEREREREINRVYRERERGREGRESNRAYRERGGEQ